MKQFRLVDNIVGWLAFFIAAFVYCSTIEPTASFWDCPEFITTGYKLEIGHPPGAPFFMLTANLFSQFASDPSQVAMMVNTMSALLSATCILFLFWTITHLTRKLILKDWSALTTPKLIAIEASGLVGALIYTFSDTFWFSAVEGEVYAYSSAFTAVVFWLILKWEDHADEPHSDRWLVLIMYMTGLSIGVHLLNLLCVSAIVLVFYYRKFNFQSFPHWWNIEDRLVRGGYSWKIAAIYDVLIESQRVLVWTDAGNLLPPDINKDLNRTFTYGAYTPYSGDNINKWVHPLSRRFMARHKMVRKIMPGRGMCDGAYMLIDYNNATVMSDVIIPYVQCAYTRKCITPYGATRKNHRQDQAIITVLMHSAMIKESCHAAYNSQVLTHNDCKQLDKCDLVKQRVLNLIRMVYF